MRSARLELALKSGAFVVPETGDILVLRPVAGDDLSSLPKARVVVRTGFRPDHDHFLRQGYRVEGGGPAGAVILCLPRAKAAARAMLAEAAALLPPGGLLAVDGQKTDGIDAVLKDCRAAGAEPGEVLAKAHGKFAVLTRPEALLGWQQGRSEVEGGFLTAPGVFSADGPDRGSVLLAEALPARLWGRVADLGAGWGYLSRAILSRADVQHLDLVEAEAEALACARLNISDPRAEFHWADATAFKPSRFWDWVVMNPPFHTSRAADPGLGIAFLQAAQRGLLPGGQLLLVANRHLPYDRTLTGLFREVEEIGGDAAFRVIRAAYPIRAR